MRELFSPTDYREIQVLTALFEQSEWWNVQALADKVECSMDSVYAIITRINQFSCSHEKNYFIEVKRRKGVFLHIDNEFSINCVYNLYLYESTRYKILDLIFQTPNLTMTKLVNTLYRSKSTIYRELTNIKKILETTAISFNTKTFEISGDEVLIRHFMLTMYWPVLSTLSWPFCSVSQQLIQHRKEAIFADFSLADNPNMSLKVDCQLAINFIRHRNHHYIKQLAVTDSIDPIRQKLVLPMMVLYEKSIPQKYQQYELNFLATLGMITNHCAADMTLINQINMFHESNQTQSFDLCNLLTNLFNEVYPDTYDHSDPILRFQLLSLANYALTYPKLKLDPNTMSDVLALHANDSPYLINNLMVIMQKIYELPEYNERLLNITDFTIDVFFHLCNCLEIAQLEKPILVKIIANHPGHEGKMKQLLKKRGEFNIIIDTSYSKNVEEPVYDLIIFEANQTGNKLFTAKHSYSSAFPPTKRDWENIEAILEEILYS